MSEVASSGSIIAEMLDLRHHHNIPTNQIMESIATLRSVVAIEILILICHIATGDDR
jgi:hypothetical protein